MRQLRTQYENTKRELEPWQKIGAKPEEAARAHQVLSTLQTEARELADTLGYDAKEVADAFAQDPIATLTLLRQTVERAKGPGASAADIKKLVDQKVAEGLKPVTVREQQRQIQEAEFRFDGEFSRLFKDNFKDGLPDECRDAIYEMAADMFGNDAEACKRIREQSLVSDVAKYFDQAKTRFLTVMSKYVEHERKRTSGGAAGDTQPAPAAKPADRTLSTGQKISDLFR